MKRILIYIFSLLWLLASCQRPELLESVEGGDSEGTVEVSFSVLMPENSAATKALGDEPSVDIKSMHLVIFDENGYFIETKEAYYDPPKTHECTHENEQPFKVTLRKTDKERIIHFIANCPVDQIHYGHESDIISNLYVSRGSEVETAYWYRTEVWYIKTTSESSNQLLPEIADKFKCVPLLRNFAQVSVVDDASDFVLES